MVTPIGLPAWTRTATAAGYGGVAGKRNLGNIGAVNAKTDVTAEEFVRATADLAHAVRTSPLFWMRFTTAHPSDLAITVNYCQPMWCPGATYLAYDGAVIAPPDARLPQMDGTNTIDIVLSFPGILTAVPDLSVADEFGAVGAFRMHSFALSGASASLILASMNATGTEITLGNAWNIDDTFHLVVW